MSEFFPSDARKHTGHANTERRCRVWADAANSVFDATGNRSQAIKLANSKLWQLYLSRKVEQGRKSRIEPRLL